MARTHTISSKYFKIYKWATVVLLLIFVLFYSGFYAARAVEDIFSAEGLLMALLSLSYIILVLGYWFPSYFKMIKAFRAASYDKENLYVDEGGYEVVVPFHRIKDVEIKSLDGVYKISFYDKDQFGDHIFLKPSMWYPFNFPKVDAQFQELRSRINKSKREYRYTNDSNQLNSSY